MRRFLGILSSALLVATIGLFATPRAALATPTFAGVETRITDNLADQFDPSISGDIIVYTDTRGFDPDIYYYDLATHTEHAVTTAAGIDQLSDVSDGTIVYADFAGYYAHAYSTLTGTDIVLGGGVNTALDPAIGQGLAAWMDDASGVQQIHARSLLSGEERVITNDAPGSTSQTTPRNQSPAVDHGLIVWQKCVASCDIFAYDWATGATTQVTSTPDRDERFPDVSNGRVVYQVLEGTELDIAEYEVAGRVERRLSLPGGQKNPNISGDNVTFDDTSTGVYHVRLWNLASDAVFDVSGGAGGSQYLNDIDGNRIVYTDDRNGQLDIYLFTFQLSLGDTTPPTIAIATPANGATYLLKGTVAADYSCTDDVAVARCVGPVASGAAIDTASVGEKAFTVEASDGTNTATASATYRVSFGQKALYDQARAVKSGAVVAIRLQLVDGLGANVSSAGIVVSAQSVRSLAPDAPGVLLEDAGSANPDDNFRFDPALGVTGGYIYNLSTKGFATGTYELTYLAAGDLNAHTVQFQVK